MTEGLRARLDHEIDQALQWQPGDNPSPVLAALGYALWARVLNELDHIPPDRIRALSTTARRALLTLGTLRDEGEDTTADDTDAQAADQAINQLQALAHAGLQALTTTPKPPKHQTKLHPPDQTLIRMFHGKAAPLTTARYAAHALSCKPCQQKVDALRIAAQQAVEEPLAVAAAAPAGLRDPRDGRVVAVHEEWGLEAVLFDDGHLAVYAEGNEPLRLVADGVVTEETLGGYWLGRVEPGVVRLEAAVHLGGTQLQWSFAL